MALLQAVGPVGPRILDLGCGIGNGVDWLLSQGFDAYGVDVYEYWGRDRALYWSNESPRDVTERLSVAPLDPYVLPYDDQSFDHVISAEVLEHVTDRSALFREIHRILKPGGTSVHIFPRRWSLMEPHIRVPVPVFCKYRPYLKAMAVLGFRSARQTGLGWRETYSANVEQMRISHYPRRSAILAEANAAGLQSWYARKDYIARAGTGWTRLYRRIGPAAFLLGGFFLGSMLAVKRPPA
jgi:SAM-dependent methyltransferase